MSEITVIIPARDEASHIARCVASARQVGRVIVVDSGSGDATREIAASCGAEVVEHAWEGHAGQKNWALEHLDIATEWVLFLDADEFLLDETVSEVREAVAAAGVAGYELPRRYVFLDRELRHAWWYPDYQLRLFRRAGARCEDVQVHEHMIVDGPVRQLRAPIMHENLKGLSAFVERHNRYSDLEAAELANPASDRKRGSFTGSWAERRRALKDRVWFRLPMRPLVRFLWLYFVKRGFLDGRRGLLFCSLIAMYDFLIDVKLLERRLAAPSRRTAGEATRGRPQAERASRADLLRLLVCPDCRDGELVGLDAELVDGEVRCSICGAAYPVRDGIPVLLPAAFDASGVHDELEHPHEHKHRQADYFDRAVAEEFEIERPRGAPEAYGWLLRRKFRRSVERLPQLDGGVVVDACCGSGMDAEMLARDGARVIAIDISEGCARRARERARRRGLDYLVVVGDVEHLPLRDGAADVSYVHDGLHHLADPASGVRELARVARGAVSINEPADALGTAAMVRLGVSLEREEAGNRVARLRAADVARELARAGFEARARRYLMYYRHEPGSIMRLASRPVAGAAYRALVSAADAALGRWGNKLQVTGRRRAAQQTTGDRRQTARAMVRRYRTADAGQRGDEDRSAIDEAA